MCIYIYIHGDARPLMAEIERDKADQEPTAELGVLEDGGEWQKYGSKLAEIVHRLRSIQSSDSAAKSIVFCQWESLLLKIASAFRDFGIKHARLQGTVYARSRTITDFKDPNSNIDVLLLSLQQSASGTNLTCANHVFFVQDYRLQFARESQPGISRLPSF